jgi:hypothetical protein
MKSKSLLLLCLGLNALLAAALLFTLRHRPGPAPANAAPTAALQTSDAAGINPPPTAPPTAPPAVAFAWRMIESADYPQYIANLRAVDCPEWLIRDIIVADIDDLYQAKSQSAPAYIPPWRGADRRRAEGRARAARKYALQVEKRALVKALLGYEWDSHANEVWDQDTTASLVLGFLPDAKASQVVALVAKYTEAVQEVREDANFILIEQDRARQQALYDGLITEAGSVLNSGELDELQLRAQAQGFFLANDMHFDGVGIGDAELHAIARLSKLVKDIVKSEFVDERNVSAEEQDRKRAAFDEQVRLLLGAARYADYQRAQDPGFREVLDFTQRGNLNQATAVKLYEARRTAEEQAAQVQADHSLSPEEQTSALVVLKAATARSVSSILGDSYRDYVGGPGHWLENLAAAATPPAQN